MCRGDDCPMKQGCFRFLAKPDERQSFFVLVPYSPMFNKCEYLWPISKK